MLINFTQKAIHELEIKKLLLDRTAPEVALEGDENTWHCTDLEIYDDATAVLVVHKLTWFCFPIICKNYKGAQIVGLIRDGLLQTLMGYEVPAPQIDRFMKASESIHFAKGDNNKRLLGIVNSMKASIKFRVDRERDNGRTEDWFQIMVNTNSMLYGAPDYTYPVEKFIKLYGGKRLGFERFRNLTLVPPQKT